MTSVQIKMAARIGLVCLICIGVTSTGINAANAEELPFAQVTQDDSQTPHKVSPSHPPKAENTVANSAESDQSEDDDTQDDAYDDEYDANEQDDDEEDDEVEQKIITQRTIKNIRIDGNHIVTTASILNRVPYQIGEIFDANKTAELIKNVYNFGNFEHGIGYFKNVTVSTELVGTDGINLVVQVQEKLPLEGIELRGNKHLGQEEITKKIDLATVPAIDTHDLAKIVAIIRRLYRDKNYLNVEVTSSLKVEGNKALAVFDIVENKKTFVKRVLFEGNTYFSGKILRSMIFTREDWILDFIDKAGMYQPDAIEADKQTIEHFYQSHGFINAKVIQVDVQESVPGQLDITFHIQEGDIYRVSEVHAPGNDAFSEEQLLSQIPINPGEPYSREKIRQTLELLRLVYGELGYIYADIEPSIQPDDDRRTVAITFYTELGSKMQLRRLNIIGNYKTRDKVIRRQVSLVEGEIITSQKMDQSKNNVELLGFFDQRDGVNWKIHRIDKKYADLDLIVREIKTGKINFRMGFGGAPDDFQNPAKTLTFASDISESNLFGLGILVNLSGEVSSDYKNFNFGIADPWMFDRPIRGGVDLFLKRSTYNEFELLQDNDVYEKNTGANFSLGYQSARLNYINFAGDVGISNLSYNKMPEPRFGALSPIDTVIYQQLLNNRFVTGTFVTLALAANQDTRNHPMHPSRGHKWIVDLHFGLPARGNNFAYAKFDADLSWYTPLIGERTLVFVFHTHLGLVGSLKDGNIPYRELYHIGGPASVRGFLFGQIGPTFKNTESLGAKRAFWINAEMVFPISPDFRMKGAVFYDGGAGWNTPPLKNLDAVQQQAFNMDVRHNTFDYRHAVGFGIRLLQPTPMQIDWAYKLDKRKGEPTSEVHFSMYHNF